MATEEPQQNQNINGETEQIDSPRENVKNVFIYKNGDPFYKPHRFTINNKQIRNYETFLTQVTSTIKPRFGCVRKLHTPDHGHRVSDLEALEPGRYYVAAGQETFSKLPYNQIPEKEARPLPRLQKQITPVYHSRIQVSARARKPLKEPLTLFVFENGNSLKPSCRVLLTPRELESWEQILSAVGDKVTLSTKGAVRWLYTLSGQRIVDWAGLQNNESYVAVGGDGKFMQADYGAAKRPINTSPKLDRKRYERLELDGLKSKQSTNSSRYGWSNAWSSRDTSRDASTSQSSTDYRSHQSKSNSSSSDSNKNARARPNGVPAKKKQKSTGSTSSRRTDDSDPFQGSGNSSHKKGQKKPADYDNKDDGPFKSRAQSGETRGAREVEDGTETKVDLPIDQVEAEEVQEEEVDQNKKDKKSTNLKENISPTDTQEKKEKNKDEKEKEKEKKQVKKEDNKEDNKEENEEDDDEEKERQRRDQAAVKIQAQYRGHAVRKEKKTTSNN